MLIAIHEDDSLSYHANSINDGVIDFIVANAYESGNAIKKIVAMPTASDEKRFKNTANEVVLDTKTMKIKTFLNKDLPKENEAEKPTRERRQKDVFNGVVIYQKEG